jgi:hypothetical protein
MVELKLYIGRGIDQPDSVGLSAGVDNGQSGSAFGQSRIGLGGRAARAQTAGMRQAGVLSDAKHHGVKTAERQLVC